MKKVWFFIVVMYFYITGCFAVYTYHPFSISDTQQVFFSPGNLQFNAVLDSHKCADGKIKAGTWRFAEHQWDYVGTHHYIQSSTSADGKGNVYYNGLCCDNYVFRHMERNQYACWADMFGWATSGWDNTEKRTHCFEPWHTGFEKSFGPSMDMVDKDLVGSSKWHDWGQYNAIRNGDSIDPPETWRTMTIEEWLYLTNREDENGNLLYGLGGIALDTNVETLNELCVGFIFLPDDWEMPAELTFNNISAFNCGNIYTILEWEAMEERGAVFFPFFKRRAYYVYISINVCVMSAITTDLMLYWTSSHYDAERAYGVPLLGDTIDNMKLLIPRNGDSQAYDYPYDGFDGARVRLVRDGFIHYDTICQGETFVWHDIPYTTSGLQNNDSRSLHDTILHLTVLSLSCDTIDTTICLGDTCWWNEQPYTQTGTYLGDTLAYDNRCNINILHLTVSSFIRDTAHITVFDTILPYKWHNRLLQQSGTYYDTLRTQQGCDSVLCTLYLTVLIYCPPIQPHPADIILWHGQSYTHNGTFNEDNCTPYNHSNYITICSSKILSVTDNLQTITLCNGDTITWLNYILIQKGIYYDTLRDHRGCDSLIYTLQLDTISCPSCINGLIVQKWNDVLLIDNNENQFAEYQWYKNGEPIPNAINQMVTIEGGIRETDTYCCQLVTNSGLALRTCEITTNTIRHGKQTSLFDINDRQHPKKIIRNGHLYILKNGNYFSPLGILNNKIIKN